MEYEKVINLLDNELAQYAELINLLETSVKIYSDTRGIIKFSNKIDKEVPKKRYNLQKKEFIDNVRLI